jgi:hypothetical protein
MNATRTQAQRIYDVFDGVPKLHAALQKLGKPHARSLTSIYRWNTERKPGVKGSNGVVPTSAMESIIKAAKAVGAHLPRNIFDPRPL